MKPRALLTGAAALAILTACSSTSEGAVEPEAPPSQTSSPASPTGLPLTAHVVTDLVGFSPSQEPVVQDVATFAQDHDKTAADLIASGLISGTTVHFEPDSKVPGNAISIAEQFATAEQAAVEGERLFAANAEPDKGATGVPLEVPGIPEVSATTITGTFRGQPFTSVEIVFVEAEVVHELFAIGAGRLVSSQDLVEAATELYVRVHDHPVE
jgi:hypothetical protein